jgi:16S rRNA (uracil1498-N3)-methyltransferase
MLLRRFYIPVSQIAENGKTAFLEGTDVHHIVHVLRKAAGDSIDATDGQGNVLKAKILLIEEDKVKLEIIERKSAAERKTVLRLFQALPKGGIFEEIISKVTELGVDDIVPVVTERTVKKYDEEHGLKKMARWERIILETMKQTGRVSAPSLHPPVPLKGILDMLRPDALKIFPWELEEKMALKELLQVYKGTVNVELIIGPEGGFSLSEAEFLKSCGFHSVTLGKRILKVETAAVVTVGNIYYGLE